MFGEEPLKDCFSSCTENHPNTNINSVSASEMIEVILVDRLKAYSRNPVDNAISLRTCS